MNWKVRILDEVASTNSEVKRAIDAGAPEGVVVAARRQTAGYGRQGRLWGSPEGGLYFSMLLRPQVSDGSLATISLAAGLAVRRALVRFVDRESAPSVMVKWPNDIVVASPGNGDGRFRKLCGISCEARGHAACVGIGVNMVRIPSDGRPGAAMPILGKNDPVYLDELAGFDRRVFATAQEAGARVAADAAFADPGAAFADDRSAGAEQTGAARAAAAFHLVMSAILDEFDPLYRQWLRRGFASIVDEYADHEALSGSIVNVVDRIGNLLASGEALGVDASGCLRVRGVDGRVSSVASGEAHIR